MSIWSVWTINQNCGFTRIYSGLNKIHILSYLIFELDSPVSVPYYHFFGYFICYFSLCFGNLSFLFQQFPLVIFIIYHWFQFIIFGFVIDVVTCVIKKKLKVFGKNQEGTYQYLVFLKMSVFMLPILKISPTNINWFEVLAIRLTKWDVT